MPWISILNKVSLFFAILVAIMLAIMVTYAVNNHVITPVFAVVFFSMLIMATVSRAAAINLELRRRPHHIYVTWAESSHGE